MEISRFNVQLLIIRFSLQTPSLSGQSLRAQRERWEESGPSCSKQQQQTGDKEGKSDVLCTLCLTRIAVLLTLSRLRTGEKGLDEWLCWHFCKHLTATWQLAGRKASGLRGAADRPSTS